MSYAGLNSLGYQAVREIPEILTNAEQAARQLRAESGGDAERQIATLRGIGYALLALAEKVPELPPAAAKPRRPWFRTGRSAS